MCRYWSCVRQILRRFNRVKASIWFTSCHCHMVSEVLRLRYSHCSTTHIVYRNITRVHNPLPSFACMKCTESNLLIYKLALIPLPYFMGWYWDTDSERSVWRILLGRWFQAGTTSMSDGRNLLPSMIVSDNPSLSSDLLQILQNQNGFRSIVVSVDTTCNLVNALLHSTTLHGLNVVVSSLWIQLVYDPYCNSSATVMNLVSEPFHRFTSCIVPDQQ
jgi:hypothetical protein